MLVNLWNLLAKYDNLKRRKLKKNLPKSSKNLDNFITFFLQMWWFLKKISKRLPRACCLGPFYHYSKMVKFGHPKKKKKKEKTCFGTYIPLWQPSYFWQKIGIMVVRNGGLNLLHFILFLTNDFFFPQKENRVIGKVTLSLGLLSSPLPSFSGIHKVRKFY
jgi:hypothetical protein